MYGLRHQQFLENSVNTHQYFRSVVARLNAVAAASVVAFFFLA
jgi:hypothetical protein